MELIPEWAPNIHPILVHFPIAIILLAFLMDLLNFFLPDKWWDNLKSTILYGVGAISAIVAYINKEMAVHGHGEAPEAGSVGLKIDGNGTILIDSISLTQLN